MGFGDAVEGFLLSVIEKRAFFTRMGVVFALP
jgi:hypothetical protein